MWLLPRQLSVSLLGAQASNLDLPSAAYAAEQSLTLNEKPTRAPTWLRAWKKKSWLQLLFGRMFAPSTVGSGVERWIASLADSPARTSRTQATAAALQDPSLDSGENSGASSPRFNLNLSALKTLRPSKAADLKKSLWILLPSGSMRSGVVYARPTLAPLTVETGYSSWPTPTVHGDFNRKGASQASQASGDGLATAANNWPTPDASVSTGYNQSEHSGKKGKVRPSLAALSKNWPSPAARDWKDSGAPSEHGRHSPSLPLQAFRQDKTQSTGQEFQKTLNPQFVEWLIGLPIGWTDFDSVVTVWYLPRQLTPLDSCGPALSPTQSVTDVKK